MALPESTAAPTDTNGIPDSHQKGLHILQPCDLRGDISHSEANFGIPSFAASITGRLVYQWDKPMGCDGFNRLKGDVTILLVDRGSCSFVQKVRAAEEASANAVIVVNNDDGKNIAMADDGSGTSVNIPSVFISKAEGDKLKEAMDPIHHNGTVMVKLTWDIPSPDNHVEWELWTSSNDDNSVEFKHQFQLPATRLGLNHTFTPHFLTIDGDWFDCTTKTGQRPPHDWRCGKQCTNSGRYCAEDPEKDLGSGINGKDVVMENVRQICLWRAVNTTGQEGIWWDYVEAFQHNCSTTDATFNQGCSEGTPYTARHTAHATHHTPHTIHHAPYSPYSTPRRSYEDILPAIRPPIPRPPQRRAALRRRFWWHRFRGWPERNPQRGDQGETRWWGVYAPDNSHQQEGLPRRHLMSSSCVGWYVPRAGGDL
jgi:hypothetical protein